MVRRHDLPVFCVVWNESRRLRAILRIRDKLLDVARRTDDSNLKFVGRSVTGHEAGLGRHEPHTWRQGDLHGSEH